MYLLWVLGMKNNTIKLDKNNIYIYIYIYIYIIIGIVYWHKVNHTVMTIFCCNFGFKKTLYSFIIMILFCGKFFIKVYHSVST